MREGPMKHVFFCGSLLLSMTCLLVSLCSCSLFFEYPEAGTSDPTATGTVTGGNYAGGEAADATNSQQPTNRENGAVSGQYASVQSDKLHLLLDYTRTPGNGGTDVLTVTIRLSSYSLSVGARPHLGKVTVGDETLTFSTDALEISENGTPTLTELFSHSFTIPGGEAVSVAASWHFGGTYSGVEIQELTVSGLIVG